MKTKTTPNAKSPPKIDLRPRATTRAITISLKFATIERLDQMVEKGSWSILIDQAINAKLDQLQGGNHE